MSVNEVLHTYAYHSYDNHFTCKVVFCYNSTNIYVEYTLLLLCGLRWWNRLSSWNVFNFNLQSGQTKSVFAECHAETGHHLCFDGASVVPKSPYYVNQEFLEAIELSQQAFKSNRDIIFPPLSRENTVLTCPCSSGELDQSCSVEFSQLYKHRGWHK